MSDDPKSTDPKAEKTVENQEIDEFFHRLPSNFRWPKPNADAVAAAVEIVQRMSGGATVAQEMTAAGEEHAETGTACSACGGALPENARFCVWCGVPRDASLANSANFAARSGSQHHVHHHYHHVMTQAGGPSTAPGAQTDSAAPRSRAAGTGNTAPGSRAEVAARQVVQDWAQACNIRQIDDLLELYTPDATLIRASVPPVRSLPAIREFLVSVLEAGLGDIEMESLRVEMLGDIAIDLGRCKMLVPVAMGKRREERGKYLIVLVRQSNGTWKILADSWSTDTPVAAPHARSAKS